MGSFSLSHWLIVLVVILILFGAGRIPAAMGDLARGIRAFRWSRRSRPISRVAEMPAQGAALRACGDRGNAGRSRSRIGPLAQPHWAARAAAAEMTHVDA
jgi:sec-independent protein translocase protein TatA